jgi:glycosyltransferase involved in cell wall biosynthesis
MKILLTADPEVPVPPTLYGGIERVIDQLAKGYSQCGHEVILVAHSSSSCEHVVRKYGWPGKCSRRKWHTIKNTLALRKIVLVEKPDVIHSFSRLAYLFGVLPQGMVIIQSYQRKISNTTTFWAKRLFGEKLILSACGKHMIAHLEHQEYWTTIPNCCDTSFLAPIPHPSRKYLVFLGRIEPIKGVIEAIEFATLTNHELIIAGNVEPEWRTFFETRITPLVNNSKVRYIGPVNDSEKKELLCNAKAFLMLVQWEEPFGIVMAEALSCGVPVIALNRGSVPEIVTHGFNGIRGDTLDQLVDAFPLIESINRSECRADALRRFSIESVVKQYLARIA